MRNRSGSRVFVLATLVSMTGCPGEKGSGATDSDTTDASTSDAGGTTSTTSPTSDATAGTSEADEERFCVGAGPGSAPVLECGIDFCPPDALHVEADNAGGGEGLVRESKYAGSPQLYKYRADEEELALWFDAVPDDASTDVWLAEHLLDLSLRIDHPFPDLPGLGSMSTHFHSSTSPWLFEVAAFEGGRFKMTAEIDVTEATQHVYSSDEACYIGDQGGMCRCHYEGFAVRTTIAIDLSLAHGS